MKRPIIYPLQDNEGYTAYEQVVSQQIKKSINDMDFKSNPDYCQVLEHVDQRFGCQYLALIQQEFPESLDKLQNFIKRKICYARVSTRAQMDDLEKQVLFFRQTYPSYEVVTDI